jgi:6-pyruvoyltetrahydropterin/6-carboxytetrahydropterin synthase
MITISKSYSFDASHRLMRAEWDAEQNETAFGKCSRLHGHTYTLEVEVTGEVDKTTGMIFNYFDLDKVVKPIVDRLDHYDLNNIFMMLTTAENMVENIAGVIETELARVTDYVKVRKVTLSETPKTKAVWHGQG